MKTLIYGYGKSGQVVEDVLKDCKTDYDILDAKGGDNVKKKIKKAELKKYDTIIFSPGITIKDKVLRCAQKIGINTIGELEYGYQFVSGDIITVTGTNGKTSTVRLIGDLLSPDFDVALRGNIGAPLSQEYFDAHKVCVVEASSFQLESIKRYKSKINIMLNIAPNHLDRHKNMREYIDAKFNMFTNNDDSTINIINFDDQSIMSKVDKIKGEIIFISLNQKVHGIYYKNGCIYCNLSDKSYKLCKTSDLNIHFSYIYDYLAGIAVAMVYGINITDIISRIKKFKISENRQEVVGVYKGVAYINDSKSTNVHSTINCVTYISSPVILLMGGKSKHIPFDDIFLMEKLPKYIIAFGASRKEIYKTAKKYSHKNILIVKTLQEAVALAKNIAKEGDCVVLSPACASFDEFASYSERGEKFKDWVRE